MIDDIKGVLMKLAETENYCRSLEHELKEVKDSRDMLASRINQWSKKDILIEKEEN